MISGTGGNSKQPQLWCENVWSGVCSSHLTLHALSSASIGASFWCLHSLPLSLILWLLLRVVCALLWLDGLLNALMETVSQLKPQFAAYQKALEYLTGNTCEHRLSDQDDQRNGRFRIKSKTRSGRNKVLKIQNVEEDSICFKRNQLLFCLKKNIPCVNSSYQMWLEHPLT